MDKYLCVVVFRRLHRQEPVLCPSGRRLDTFFDVYPEFVVEPDQLEAFQRERNACVIGIDLARRYNLKLGDIMNLEGDVVPGPMGVRRCAAFTSREIRPPIRRT